MHRTRRPLVIFAAREIPWETVARFVRSAFPAPARFASATLVLSHGDGLVDVHALPAGSRGAPTLTVLKPQARFGDVAKTLPASFVLP